MSKTILYKASWLVLLLFVFGYIATFSTFYPVALKYLGFTLLSIFVCLLLLTKLSPPLVNELPIWIIFGVFIGAYYFKFYLMVCFFEYLTENVYYGYREQLYWLTGSSEPLLDTYATMTYAFATFCLTSWGLLLHKKTRWAQTFKKVNYKHVIPLLSLILPVIIIVIAIIIYITEIGKMGAEPLYNLPFRLAGVIFYIQVTFIPAFLLLFIWCSDEAHQRNYLLLGIVLLSLYALSDMLLRSSRGSLLVIFMMLIVLFIVTGRTTKQRVRLFIIVIFATIFLWPVISSYRDIRAKGTLPIVDSLSKATEWVYGSGTLLEILGKSCMVLLARFIGVDSLLVIIASGVQPLGAEVFNTSVVSFLTVDVIGYPLGHPMGLAPSLPGWFYIVGGNLLVVVGMFCFVFLTWIIWRAFLRTGLLCLPVAQALFLVWIFKLSSGGVLDRFYLEALAIIGAISVCEWLLRRYGSYRFFNNVGVAREKGVKKY